MRPHPHAQIGVDVRAERARPVGPRAAEAEVRAPVDVLLGPVDAVGPEDRVGFPEVAVDAGGPVPGVALVEVRVDLEEAREDEEAPEVGHAYSRRIAARCRT